MENWSLSKIILTVGALAIVAGASFLISSAGNKPALLERPPEVIENIDPNKDVFKGQRNQPGGISVVPTEIIVKDAAKGVKLPDVIVRNGSQTKQTMKINFVPVTRALTAGGAVIPSRPEDIARGKKILRLDTNKIVLNPGQSKAIGAQVIGGDNQKMTIGAINIEIQDDSNTVALPEEKGVAAKVKNLLQISSMVYLIFDKPDSERISLKGLQARSDNGSRPEDGIRFFATVQSENDFLSTPKGVVIIQKSTGETTTVSFVGDQNVFPRQRREIFTERPLKLAPGDYEIEARVVSGNSGQSIKKSLEVASNRAPVDISSEALIATDRVKTLPGQPFPISVEVLNSGNKSFTPKGTVSLYLLGEEEPILTEEVSFDSVSPGDATTSDLTLAAPEQQGIYSVTADLVDEQDKFLAQASAEMIVTETGIIKKSQADKIRDWLSDNPLRSIAVGILGFGLLTVLIVGAISLIQRIKRKDS